MKSKDMRLLNRREFNGLCVALGSFASPTRAAGLDAAAGAASTGAGRTAKFRDGTVVPALGQGSAGLGKGRYPEAVEEVSVIRVFDSEQCRLREALARLVDDVRRLAVCAASGVER